MSAKALGWVFDNSTATGVTLMVHVAIADSVNDQNDDEFWMRLARLAVKARCTRGTAGKSVTWLIDHGYLLLLTDRSGGRGQAARYRFLYPEKVRAEDALCDEESARTARSSPEKVRAERARIEPKVTTNPKQPVDAVRRTADRVVTEWWERRKAAQEPTAQSYIAVVKIVERALRNGVSNREVAHALDDCPTVTGAALEFALSKRRGKVGRQAPAISEEAARVLIDDYNGGDRPPAGSGLPLALPPGGDE